MNAVESQVLRGFRRAAGPYGSTRGAGKDCVFTRGAQAPVNFRAIVNTLPSSPEKVDLNEGDNTKAIATAAVEDFPQGLPKQGESFRDSTDNLYPVEGYKDFVAGHPLVHLRIGNVTQVE